MNDNIWMALHNWTQSTDFLPHMKKPLRANFPLPLSVVVSPEILALLKPYHKDLVKLYVLDHECSRLIYRIADLVYFHPKQTITEQDVYPFLESFTKCCPEIAVTMKLDILASDVLKARTYHLKTKQIQVPETLHTLEMLQYAVQEIILTGAWDIDAKTKSFLSSYRLSYSEYGEEEAIVYLISREESCEEVEPQILSLWKAGKNGLFFWPNVNLLVTFLTATMLRMKGLVDFPGFMINWENADDALYTIVTEDPGFIETIFPFFRSDYALDLMKPNLERWLFKAQEELNGYHIEGYFSSPKGHKGYSKCVRVAAEFIFGCCRLNTPLLNQHTYKNAIEYLIESQEDDGSWHAETRLKFFYGDIYHTALAVHALAAHAVRLGKLDGWNYVIPPAKEWLLKQRCSYGCWNGPDEIDPVFLTVLVLDAIELANGGMKVTFNVEDNKQARAESQGTKVPFETQAQSTSGLPPVAIIDEDGDITRGYQSSARLTVTDLAEKYSVPFHALRKRLERLRNLHKVGWYEVQNPDLRDARFEYVESAVMSIIQELRKKYSRPPNVQRK